MPKFKGNCRIFLNIARFIHHLKIWRKIFHNSEILFVADCSRYCHWHCLFYIVVVSTTMTMLMMMTRMANCKKIASNNFPHQLIDDNLCWSSPSSHLLTVFHNLFVLLDYKLRKFFNSAGENSIFISLKDAICNELKFPLKLSNKLLFLLIKFWTAQKRQSRIAIEEWRERVIEWIEKEQQKAILMNPKLNQSTMAIMHSVEWRAGTISGQQNAY